MTYSTEMDILEIDSEDAAQSSTLTNEEKYPED